MDDILLNQWDTSRATAFNLLRPTALMLQVLELLWKGMGAGLLSARIAKAGKSLSS